jgi:hypothetical protein
MKLDDYGGIYTYADKTKTNRIVNGNIVLNGIGCTQGRYENDARTHAYYFDGSSRNLILTNNSAAYTNGTDFLGNSIQNVTITGNTFYGSPIGIYISRFPNTSISPGDLVRNLRVSQNIIYPTESNFFYWNGQLNEPVVTDIQTDMRAIGTMDSNYYNISATKPWHYWYHETVNGIFHDGTPFTTLSSWQTFIAGESHSQVLSTAANVFQYNASNSPIVYNFVGYSKKDVYGTVYNNSATIPAWSSKILFDNGAAARVGLSLNNNTSVGIYPNPVKNIANLHMPANASKQDEKITVSVADMNGKIVMKKQLISAGNKSDLKLDMSGLNGGLYIINLKFKSGKIISKKILKTGRNR